MPAHVPERRRDGKGQPSVGVLRRHEGNVRRAAALAFPSEGDADATQPQPAQPRGRRVPVTSQTIGFFSRPLWTAQIWHNRAPLLALRPRREGWAVQPGVRVGW